MEGTADVEVPPYFTCPISLQIMRDPVTLTTGITYDRDTIEKWIFSAKNPTCPVSKQPVPDSDIIPNHTLRRLIQSWCAANASRGVERFPTPRPPADKAQISKLLDEARKPKTQMGSLLKLKELVAYSERNKRCAEAAGTAEVMVSIIRSTNGPSPVLEEQFAAACDEALNILHSLQTSEERLRDLVVRNFDIIGSLTSILRHSSYQSRAYATFLIKSISKAISPVRLSIMDDDLFVEILRVLRDQISYSATKAALHVLCELCPWGRNRVKATEAGAVPVLIELLLDGPEKRVCEMVLIVLDQLCRCAEGRQELVHHAAGISVVSKKMVRVSALANEKAVRVLYSLSTKSSATPGLLQEMLQLGVVSRLFLVLQMDCGLKTREKANEILQMHSRVWKNSPCIHPQFRSSYPSC